MILALLLGLTPAPMAKAETEAAGIGKQQVATDQEGAAEEQAEEKGKSDEVEYPETFGPIISETAIPIDKGALEIQPLFSLGFITDTLTQSWRRETAGGNFKSFGMEWKFNYGIWDNMEAFIVVPYVHNWANDVNEPGPNGQRSANSGGIGDISFTAKYMFIKETDTIPTVTFQFTTDFPTGRFRRPNPAKLETDIIGGGAYVFTAGLDLSKYLQPFVIYGNVWYSMSTAYSQRVDDENGQGVDIRTYPRDFVTLNLAAEYPITKKWIALVELLSFWDGGRLLGHKANVPPAALVSVLPGIEYMAHERVALALGVQVDLIGKNTDAAVTPIFSALFKF
ncbi:MAG: transporter [Desulfobacca sp.]